MCRFYAWHMDCPILRKNGRCDFLHDKRIRDTHDAMLHNNYIGAELTIYEYKEKLVENYNPEILLHQKDLIIKEEALNKYPMKPTHKV